MGPPSISATGAPEAHAPSATPPAPTREAGDGRWSRGWIASALVTVAAAVLPAVAWPDQISWNIDEPQLVARAYHANRALALAERGLVGNFGLSYGPTATQIYQLMLGVTHDPFTLARLRAGLCAGVTALGLLWLARTLRLNPWFAAAVVLAPFLWVFQRILWDASFAIPIGTVALAAYASFLRHGGRGALLLALAATLTMPFIHPQDLPLAVPILLHAAWRHHRDLWHNAGRVLFVVAVIVALNATYFMHLFAEISYYMAVGLPKRYPGGHSVVATYLGPIGLDGPAEWALHAVGIRKESPTWPGRHLLAGHGYMGPGDGGFGPLVGMGKYGLYVFYPLLWGGIAVAVWRLFPARAAGRRDDAGVTAEPAVSRAAPGDGDRNAKADVWLEYGGVTRPARRAGHRGLSLDAARAAVGGIALFGVAMQMLMAGLTRVPAEPQYFFGTFVLHALLAWLAVDALARVRLSHAAVLAYGLSAAAVTLGTMRHYYRPPAASAAAVAPVPATAMPTLGDSVAVVEALRRYPARVPAVTDIDFYHRFPQTLRTLRLLVPPAGGTSGETPRPLVIRLRAGPDAAGPRVEVIEAASASDIPAGARRINVAPLPAGWRGGDD